MLFGQPSLNRLILSLYGHLKHLFIRIPFFADALVRWRIYQQFQLGKSKGFLPTHLWIEDTNYCNAKCIMCPYLNMERQKGIMSLDMHNKIIDKVAGAGAPITRIIHAGFGEPLMDKMIAKKIRYEKKIFKRAKVVVYTNGSLLNERITRELISANLDCISISFNGFIKDTYEAVMQLPMERIQQNIAKFLELNTEAGRPTKVQVTLVPTKLHSNEEIKDFIRYWRKKVDAVIISRCMSWGGFSNTNKKTQLSCHYIWRQLSIDWNGKVKMCCEDFDTKYPIGNLLTQSLFEIFNSPRMQNQRLNHVKGNFQWPEICRNCIGTYDEAREVWLNLKLFPIH